MKRLALALSLLCACATAAAGPTYHVAVDTRDYAGQSGYLDFLLLGQAAASAMHATLSGFAGIEPDGGAADIAAGDVSGSAARAVVLGNDTGWNEFGLWTRFTGQLAFDVAFDIDPLPGAGSTLEVALLDAGLNYLGPDGDVLTFATLPGAAPVVTATAAVRLPEAPAPALCLTGLALLGLARRRRA
ncbi:NF038129 family PEP-CTERM protein [Massilia luteola]|uniref:NF038129 family PEP-CTERM protein n=1 Tax=Massilia luteola TaxID=3081751 RepID=UPI002ACC20DC|nr:NF038129 family PEP-CTERM protein [Massilia sp. Gc5]